MVFSRTKTERTDNLSNRIFSEEQKKFLREKRKNSEQDRQNWQPISTQRYKFKDFHEYLEDFLSDLKENEIKINQIKQLMTLVSPHQIENRTIVKLIEKLNSLNTIRTFIYHQLYLDFTTESNPKTPKGPKIDKLSDGIQLIESAYCSAFISADKPLLKNQAKYLNPNISLISISELVNG